jgi:L-ascorbate metabolism protein UlaG (beta-lactamase superfamily)
MNTEIGSITITPILHGSLVLAHNGLIIYVDPYGGAQRFSAQKPADVVLITDIHGDHHHPETLASLNLESATLVVPQSVYDKLTLDQQSIAVVLANGEQKEINGLSISAIPMYNLPETEDSRHPKGRGNGYIITLGQTRVYISGDTEDIPEMRALQDIDVAFVCMNLPFTMDVEQAASAVNVFKPKVVYPYHYRGREGLSDVNRFKELVHAENEGIDVRLRNWYPEN